MVFTSGRRSRGELRKLRELRGSLQRQAPHDVELQEVMIKVEKQLSQLCRFIDSSWLMCEETRSSPTLLFCHANAGPVRLVLRTLCLLAVAKKWEMSTAVCSNLGPSHKQASLEFGLQLLSHRPVMPGILVCAFPTLNSSSRSCGSMSRDLNDVVTSLKGQLCRFLRLEEWKVSQPHVGHRFSAFWLSPRHWHDCDARHDQGSRQNDGRRELEKKSHV